MMLSELWLRLTFPIRRWRYARDLEEEMALHLALRAEQLERTGLSPEAAVVAARRQFGNRTRLAGASREAWGWHWLDGMAQDLRYLGRQLRRAPGFAVVACLTIAFGIAINATAFTFYDAVVLKPLPVADPGSVVRVVQQEHGVGSELLPFQAYDVLRRHARTVHSIVAETSPQALTVLLPGRDGEGRLAVARFVSPTFASALGARASLGRWFDAGDDRVVVLDHGFWTRALGADPRVIGSRLRVGSAELTIVGVAADDFAGTGLPAAAPDLWMPLHALPTLVPTAAFRTDGRPHWQLLGRLAPSTTLAQASAEIASLGTSTPDTAGKPLRLVAKRATFFQSDAGEFEVFQQASAAFMVALALILAIAAVNLVNLFAARNTAREREVTVRLALGASRARIARQLAAESVTLAVVGGMVGLVAARVLAEWIRTWLVGTMASVTGGLSGIFLDVALDWRVAVYAALLSIGIGLAVGLWPALRAARADAGAVLRQGTTSTSGERLWGKRNMLLAVQVASSLVLLTTAGMLLAGMRNARAVEPGFDAEHLLVVWLDDADASDGRQIVRRSELARRLGALPQVATVAWSRRVPFAGTHLRRATTATGPITISIDDVSDTYFDALGVPVVRGRAFTRREVESNAPVMLVSESLARLRWPAGDAVGRSVPPNDLLGGPDTTTAYTIIGIVRDLRSNFLSRVNGPSVFYPFGIANGSGAFLLRTHGAPANALHAVRAAIAAVSPTLNDRAQVVTMQGGPMSLQRLMADAPATLALVLAIAGLVLASIGVYGLISQIVTRRTREIGVHMALGARGLQIVALIARKTLRPVAWGAVAGGIGALGLAVLLRALIAMPDVPDLTFGAGAFNPLVFLSVLGALALVVIAACYFPARRAVAVDPSVALRAD